MRCSKLNVSFLLQPKRCECGNQLRSAPVHMGRKNIKLNMHTTFHWQLMFITTSRKTVRLLCAEFLVLLEKWCQAVSRYFALLNVHGWAHTPRTDRMSSDLAKLQRHMWLRWNFYSCRIVKYWLSPNYFYNTLWDVYSRIFHRLYKFLCAPYFFSNTYLTGGTNLPVQSCSVYVAKL